MGGYIQRVPDEIADTLLRIGIDYVQTKAVFTASRAKARPYASKKRRAALSRLALGE